MDPTVIYYHVNTIGPARTEQIRL